MIKKEKNIIEISIFFISVKYVEKKVMLFILVRNVIQERKEEEVYIDLANIKD